ncbi:MAG TPA: TolC family protein [Thermoanaerobaculia bacterium]
MKRAATLVALLFAGACSSFHPVVHRSVGTSPDPATTWTPPANAVPPPTPPPSTSVVLPANFTPGMTITLPQVVDIALSNNPTTRIAWLQARTAEAALGTAESAYLPEIDLDASINHSRTAVVGGGGGTRTQTTFGPSATLSYLLFDFGGRAATVEGARQALIAQNFLHNQAVQDVILRTEQAFYSYLDARALLAGQDATIKERQTELQAADARHTAGVATIADVLQARTALSQAQLNRETIEGNLRTIEGQLATTMGLPATTRFDFGELPLTIPTKQVQETVDALIARAVADRPDLAASRATAEEAWQRIREVRSEYLPSVSLSSSVGQTFVAGGGSFAPFSVGVAVRWPVFTGFRNVFDLRQAEIQADISREDVRALEQQIDLQVWTSYYGLQTATQRLTTARDLLASAQESVDVASGRYRAGVGSILDLLTAESALEVARAQEVQARADWFVAVAQLAHDTGSLETLK